MGNQIQKCCKNCIKLEVDQFTQQTRFIQINNNFNKSLRCRKFYISSQPLQKQKINQLLIFTDSSLTMTIPNFNLKLKQDQIQKLQQAIKYQVYNNNLIIKQNCFVLNPIEQQIDSQYGQFKQFPSSKSSISFDKQLIQNNTSNINNIPIQNNKLNPNNTLNQNNITNQNNILNQNQLTTKQKLRNQIQQFALRNKSRAFRFKNPLRKYNIGQIIVAIVPLFQKTQDLNALKQAVQQGLSMSQDLKSVGVSQISFMLGYEQTVFQKIILEYILGYSRSRKQYVYKRINEFVYLTRAQQQINNFYRFLNIYTKNSLQKINSVQTLRSQKDNNKNLRKLGNNNNNIKKQQIIQLNKQKLSLNKLGVDKLQNINRNNIQINNIRNNPQNIGIIMNESFGNTSYHSYEGSNLIGLQRQRINNNSQSNINISRRSFVNQFGNNLNDISQIGSKNSENTQIKNIKIKSFKSKQSNVSDYF